MGLGLGGLEVRCPTGQYVRLAVLGDYNGEGKVKIKINKNKNTRG